MQHAVQTPLGIILLTEEEQVIASANFFDQLPDDYLPEPPSDLLKEAESQIQAYFAGKLLSFQLPLLPRGTSFQSSVWHAIQQIPFGRTTTYGEIARQIEQPQAVRAVGLASGSNKIVVIIPCHRVMGANGEMTGYSAGMHRKRWLFEHEQKVMGRAQLKLF